MSALLFALLAVGWAGEAAPTLRSPRNASYAIEARLDAAARTLGGREVVTFRNITDKPTSELRFHLYYNAWRDERTSFIRSSRLGPRAPDLSEWRKDEWARCDVDSVTLLPSDGGAPQALVTAFVQPDDANEHDQTVLRAELPRPLGPGQSLQVEVKWQLKVPRPFARTGVEGQVFFFGQWFPKLGVLEADGSWNCHQFIQTEFYADFGLYDVRLTVPEGWITGATGHRVSEAKNADGTRTHVFHAEDVHDFAWSTSPLYTVYHDRFLEPGLPPVDIELLLLPDHAGLKDKYFSSAHLVLDRYGRWFRPYAWDRVTLVDPPSESQTGGMEYPMFVTSEARWLTLKGNRLTEANVMHEVGHLWWYGAVANNEFEHAWMDEALNTYSHRRLLDDAYPPRFFERKYFQGFIPFAFDGLSMGQPTYGADPYDSLRSLLRLEPLATPSYKIDERAYYLTAYFKGSLSLVTLERYLGWEVFRRALATYADRFWFRHPKPADFFAVLSETSGQDLTWFFDQAFGTTDIYDYAVDRVVNHKANQGFESIVDLRRWGNGVFPVDVRVVFADGSTADERWNGRSLWTRLRYNRPSRVTQVEVDPRHVLVLDVNYSNNSWTAQPEGPAAALKWTARWTLWLQNLLEFAAFLS